MYNRTKYMKNYYKKFPWKFYHNKIKTRCENLKSDKFKYYGGRGIKCLITAEELKELWFRDKAYLMKKPSIDRINIDGDYTYDNCHFIELKENRIKNRNKPILQFNLQGNFIKEWFSSSQVEKILGIHHCAIICCLKGKTKTSGGFKWSYKKENK